MIDKPVPTIGHNQGPPMDPMQSWRRHCWKAAKKQLFRPLPLETVRRRVRRAASLGLQYRRYELLVLGGGEVEAMLFADDTLVVTAPYATRAVAPDLLALRRIAEISGCRRLMLAGPDGHDLLWSKHSDFTAVMDAAIRVPMRSPLAAAPDRAGREALMAGLRSQTIPAGSVALIGKGSHGPAWVAGSRLAGFVPAAEFFGR